MSSGSAYLAPVWDLLAPRVIDEESTDEYREIETRSLNDPQNDSTITIKLDDNSSFLLMSEARLQVDFRVSATAVLTESDGVCIPNGWGLFSSAKCLVENTLVGDTQDPAVYHHMIASHTYSPDYAKSVADEQFFYPIKKLDKNSLGVGKADGTITPAVFARATLSGNAQALPPLTVAGTITNYPAITADGNYWFPLDDPTAELQYKVVVSNFASPNFDLTVAEVGTSHPYVVRKNPNYDESYMRGVRRILNGVQTLATDGCLCSVSLPLRELWPILRDVYSRVSRGSRFEIELKKEQTIERMFYTAKPVAGLAFTILRCSMWVPKLIPSLGTLASVESQIASTPMLQEMYESYYLNPTRGQSSSDTTRIRMTNNNSRITKILVAFQPDTCRSVLYRNPLQFEDVNLDQLSIKVNGITYPQENYVVNLISSGKQGLIRMMRDVHASTGKTFAYANGSLIDFESFVQGAQRIYMLDLTNMPQTPFRKQSISDVEISYKLSGAPGYTYTVYGLVCSTKENKTDMLKGKTVSSQV